MQHPDQNLEFPGKDPEEVVHQVLRRHWIVYIMHGLVSVALIVIPIAAFITYRFIFNLPFAFPFNHIFVLGASLTYLFLATQFTISFMNYYLDIWIVTNKRIIALEQKSLFNRVVSELALKNVQDITIEEKGILASTLSFGTIYVQTAGRRSRFTFDKTPHVYEVKEELNNLVEKEQRLIHAIEENSEQGPFTNPLRAIK